MTIIYVLEKEGIPFYVGKTLNPKTRFNSHKRKFQCDIFIIDEVEDNEWKFWEKYYISLFKSWGFKLINKNNGGGGSTHVTFSEERNKKISNSTRGKITSEETKQKISEKALGHKRNLGKHHSLEIRKKISTNNKNKIVSKETRDKKSISMKGKTHSDKTKEKMRISALGKPKSEQHKANIRKNNQPIIDAVRQANSKPVLQYDLDGNFIKEWPSIAEAKRYIKGDIYAVCSGKQNTAGKYKWEYKICGNEQKQNKH